MTKASELKAFTDSQLLKELNRRGFITTYIMSRADVFRFLKTENADRGTKVKMTNAEADHILDGFELDDSFEDQYADIMYEVVNFVNQKK
jgi:hypothetical protein